MKSIIVNGRFLSQRITGVQRYARELLKELDKIIEPGLIEIVYPRDAHNIPEFNNICVSKLGRTKGLIWENLSFPLYTKKKKGISLNLCNSAPLISPDIVCIHDIKIKIRPNDFSRKFLAWYNLLFNNETKRAKRIITVSEFSKKEICKYYHVENNKIFVIPNGWEHFKRIDYDNNALAKYGLSKDKYFFSLSSLEPNKNFKWLVEVAKKNPTSVFAIAGSVNSKVFLDAFTEKCPDNLKLLGYVTDEEAKELMKDCSAFLFPSFYEGFGIPPIEAICAGAKKVFVSDTEVMHEIFMDSVCYIDPYNSDSFATVNESNVKDPSEVLKRYSWEKSAILLKELIHSLT